MRCRECNVDLPKEYTACPLCGGKVSEDAPLIDGIRLAEYPKVETEPYKRNPFPIFLAIWALCAAAGFFFFKMSLISANVFAFIVSVVPMVWTLIFRPIFIKQLYVGNYVMMNLFPMILGGFLYCSIKDKLDYFFLSFTPAVFLGVLFILTVVIFVKPKVCKRAAPYPVLSGAVSIVASVVLAVKEQVIPYAWLGVLIICVGILAILFCKVPKETKDELKAKFSIQ